jgi:hypothetical protein
MKIHNVKRNFDCDSRKKIREQVTADENYIVAIFGKLHYILHGEFGGCGAAWTMFIEVRYFTHTHALDALFILKQFLPLLFNSLIILFLTPIYLLRNA